MKKYKGRRVEYNGKTNNDGDVAFVEDVNKWLNSGSILALTQEVSELRRLVKLARDKYLEQNSDGETDCVTPYDQYT